LLTLDGSESPNAFSCSGALSDMKEDTRDQNEDKEEERKKESEKKKEKEEEKEEKKKEQGTGSCLPFSRPKLALPRCRNSSSEACKELSGKTSKHSHHERHRRPDESAHENAGNALLTRWQLDPTTHSASS